VLRLAALIACLFALLLVYSQTAAFTWDEGFHMLVAQLIMRGKRPYLDFCFPQSPLNAYWNAFWMRLFGDTWRVVHAVAAIVATGALVLVTRFLHARFGAVTAAAGALLLGLNALFVKYTPNGAAYALCTLFLAAAYCAAISDRAALTGFFASAAAASTLLCAAAVPVFLFWILRHARRRVAKLLVFVGAALIPLVPIVRLALGSPRAVMFNLFEFQLYYRRANWEDATPHDISLLLEFFQSPAALILVALFAVGAYRVRRPEIKLSAWLAVALIAELSTAHPTFRWYFTIAIPFLAIPAAAAIAQFPRPAWTLAILAVTLAGPLAYALKTQDTRSWPLMEGIARKVDELTPRDAPAWLDEHVYFLTRRVPVEGTVFSYGEVVQVRPDRARQLHIVYVDDLGSQAAAGAYATVETCEEQEQIDALELPKIFRRSIPINWCRIFWDPLASLPQSPHPQAAH